MNAEEILDKYGISQEELDGVLSEYIIISRGVTEQKKSKDASRKGERNYRILFDNIPLPAALHEIINDKSGQAVDSKIIKTNYGFKEEIMDNKDIVNKRISELIPEDAYSDLDWLKLISGVGMNKGESKITYFSNVLQKYFQATTHYIGNNKFVSLFNDITFEKQALEEMIKTNDLKSDLLAFASHELKTPLIPVFGYIQLLYNAALEGKDMNNILSLYDYETAYNGIKRFIRVINNFLDVSGIESGLFIFNKGSYDIQSVLYESIDDLSFQARQKNITINNNCETKELFFDKKKMLQVFTNVLSNAMKYSLNDSIITINSCINDNFFEVKVIDEGFGFTQKELDAAIQLFAKGHVKQEQKEALQGAGLGLFLSNKIIKLHEGELNIYSEGMNNGATVTVKLPLKTIEEGDD